MKHSPEPWYVFQVPDSDSQWFEICVDIAPISIGLFKRGQIIGGDPNPDEGLYNAQRACDCVNACDGMDDPKKEIAAMREEIERLKQAVFDLKYPTHRDYDTESTINAANMLRRMREKNDA